MKDTYDLDEAVEIADDTWDMVIEEENKKKYKGVYKKGGHNRCKQR